MSGNINISSSDHHITSLIYSEASTIHHHDVVVLDDDCNEHVVEFVYVDSQEKLKGEVDEVSVVTPDSRRGSLYFDETDGKYGTWKRKKLDRSVVRIWRERIKIFFFILSRPCTKQSGDI